MLGKWPLEKDNSSLRKLSEFLLNFHLCKKICGLLFEVMVVAAYTCSCDCSLGDCLLILNPRAALLEKMPVMESKLSPEPVTNGEVPSQPEVQPKQGTMSTCYICVCLSAADLGALGRIP